MLGPIEGAVVKWHYSHTSARSLMPEAAQALISEKVRAGLRRRQYHRNKHVHRNGAGLPADYDLIDPRILDVREVKTAPYAPDMPGVRQ